MYYVMDDGKGGQCIRFSKRTPKSFIAKAQLNEDGLPYPVQSYDIDLKRKKAFMNPEKLKAYLDNREAKYEKMKEEHTARVLAHHDALKRVKELGEKGKGEVKELAQIVSKLVGG